MVTRDGTGGKIARQVTSCPECLAWGLMYAQGVCLACYNLAARYRDRVADCPSCGRCVPLKDGYCRLCWHQARLDRAADANNARDHVVLAPYAARVRCHQLFLADLYRPQARPRTTDRRRGVKGRPLKPPPPAAYRPSDIGAQLVLLTDLPRTYRPGSVDLRSVTAPENPWLAWALHLAHTLADNHGFDPMVRRALNRNLIMLLATHADGDLVRVSQFHRLIRRRGGGALVHVIDILSDMEVLADDRPQVFDTWLDAKLDGLAPPMAAHVRAWAYVLRDGGPRRNPRHPYTATAYVRLARPALLAWSQGYDDLREVTRDDVLAHLNELAGVARRDVLAALRSLFGWAKREAVIFRNPCARIRLSHPPPKIWQPLTTAEIDAATAVADTPQAKLCVVLAAVHAARPNHIRALLLDDIDLGNRRLTIAGRARPLDELTYQVLRRWLDHRRARWPRTANRHLLISKETALRTGPVSATFLRNLRGLAATLERLRVDRQLDEALASGGDPLHLAAVFGMETSTAIRWATNARQLLDDTHAAAPPGSLPTQVPVPHNEAGLHLGSR
ncbi:hypothetical protein [Nocardia wallacei]|uniref:hypothetical protein n=1 Tax=Nocardia wallacei TaxID=480035 RepID=UPI0024557431|nr:hypothetical protein [Nocardia wallacei]